MKEKGQAPQSKSEKVCTKCKQLQLLKYFYNNCCSNDGKDYACIKCDRERHKLRYATQIKPFRVVKVRTVKNVAIRILEKTIGLSNGCLQFTGSKSIWGYGQIGVGRKTSHAHRVIYEELVGPVPKHLVMDHLCRNRLCVNIYHLEVVTCRENLMRGEATWAARNAKKKVCIRGHEFDYVDSKGKRVCKTCKKEWYQRYGYRKEAHVIDEEGTDF